MNKNLNRKIKIARVVTIPLAFVHIKKQLSYLKDQNIDLTLISSKGEYSKVLKSEVDCPHIFIDIPREISPIRDLISLIKLYFVFKKNRFEIIHSSTPKAGLLCSIAAFLARTPIRIHTFTGQRWVTTKGILRFILRSSDKLISILNTKIYTDGPSQTQFLIDEKIVKKEKIDTIHKGSYGGIDPKKFNPDLFAKKTEVIKNEHNIKNSSIVLSFVGRVTREKGIEELITAVKNLTDLGRELDLLLIGPFEKNLDPISEMTLETINKYPNIHLLGFCNQPEKYLSISDIFCLPSYREGFGTVVLEAAAMRVPTIGTNITGLQDAIIHNETGILIPPKNIISLQASIDYLITNRDKITTLGENSRTRALKDFSHTIISKKQFDDYKKLIDKIFIS